MTTMKKTATEHHSSKDRKFPPEAYEYHDDVTPEAVERVREKAKAALGDGEWEVIDGFGREPS